MWQPWSPSSQRGSYEEARTYDDDQSDDTLTDNDDHAHSSRGKGRADDVDLEDPLEMAEKQGGGAVGLMNDETNAAMVEGAAMSPRRAQNASAPGQTTVSWLVWPLPSFTHHYFGVRYPEETRRPTDYLDGLRGVASLCVFFAHYLLRLVPNVVHEGYAHGPNNYSFFQLPFVRIIHSGGAMVGIFFIISGYVLSQRCVVAMRAGDQNKLHNALTSMTFRRAIRLFLPSIAISLVSLLFVFLGIQDPEFPQDWSWGWELDNYQFHLFDSLFRLWSWEISFDFWYARQLWTIPTEYRCSMILFLFIMMVARTTVPVRLTMGLVVITYLFYMDRWDVALFIIGMWISEINIIFAKRDERHPRDHSILGNRERSCNLRRRCLRMKKSTMGLLVMIVVGIYLAGYPDSDGVNTWGYGLVPEYLGFWGAEFTNYRFWVAIGCTMILFAISFLPEAQAVFSTPLARYLGKISYALYLVHELMAVTVRVTVLNIFWGLLGYDERIHDADSFAYRGGWILALVAYVPLVIWAADIFWRAVDVPTVKFAKWFESRCFVKQ